MGRAAWLRRFVLGMLLVLLPGWVLAAGFDCGKASTGIEKATCADKDLSLADFVLTERWQFLARHCAAMPGVSERVEAQRRWVAQSRKDFAPGDDGLTALRASYRQRNAELERDLAACALWRRDSTPLRIETVARADAGMKLPWIEAASPEVSRRINDVVFDRMFNGPAPATFADAVAGLPRTTSELVQNTITSSEFEVLRNDGRLLVLAVTAEGCFRHCEEHFTEQWNFDARTGRRLENDALFTPAGKQAVTRYFAASARARQHAALARVRKDHSADEDELEHYENCVRGWSQDATLPEPRLVARGQWQLPVWGCSFGYRPQWDELDGIAIPLTEAMLTKHLSAYGRSVLLGKGTVLDPAPTAPRCVRGAPLEAPATSPYRAIASGLDHHLVLLPDGRLATWGSDNDGQLGRELAHHDEPSTSPRIIASAIAAIAAGDNWSAALGEDGALWTWGSNYEGRLGNGRTERAQKRPGAIGHDFVALRAGGNQGLALQRDGSLWAWGGRVASRDAAGNATDVTTPWKLGEGYAQIEMGPRGDFQALGRDGTLWSWGGFTSDGSHLPADTPRKLGEGFARLAGHGLQAAFKADGSLWAWGASLAAMVDTAGERDRPPQRVGDAFEQVVAAPDDVVAALKTDGSVWLTHGRGSVTQLEPLGCGYQRIALVGASWESPTMQVQLVALRDDGALVAWPVAPANATGQIHIGAAPSTLGQGFRRLDMVDGHWGNRGPELVAVDAQGRVWQRRFLRDQPPPVDPHDWLERIELPTPAP